MRAAIRHGLSRARWRLDGGLRGVNAIVQRLGEGLHELQHRYESELSEAKADLARLDASHARTAAILQEMRVELRRLSNVVDARLFALGEQVAGNGTQLDLLCDAMRVLQESGAPPEEILAGDSVSPHAPRRIAVVATDVGILTLPASDRIMLPWLRHFGTWEDSGTLRRLLRPGATFVDVGAHVGYVTVFGATAVGPEGRVVSIEPDAENYALLKRNIAHARLTNVETHRVAAWDRPALLRLRRSETNSGDHRVSQHGEEGEIVTCATVDSLLDGAPCDVVKIDVQGVEHVAVRGMAETIRRFRPTILVEFSPDDIMSSGARPLEVLASYRELGYEPRLAGARGGEPLSDRAVIAAVFRDPRQWVNLVLQPVEAASAHGTSAHPRSA